MSLFDNKPLTEAEVRERWERSKFCQCIHPYVSHRGDGGSCTWCKTCDGFVESPTEVVQ